MLFFSITVNNYNSSNIKMETLNACIDIKTENDYFSSTSSCILSSTNEENTIQNSFDNNLLCQNNE